MTTEQSQKAQAKAMRHSFGPYYLQRYEDGQLTMNPPGETYGILQRGFAPSAEDVRQMLLKLRETLKWSRAMLAAHLGVSRDVVRRWETGERNPSGPARRLIWLSYSILREPDRLRLPVELVVWGKGNECLKAMDEIAKLLPDPLG